MLDEHNIDFTYREYRQEPLTDAELHQLFEALDESPTELLRRRDKAYTALDLTGDESDEVLIQHMAANPTLLQRPIGIVGKRAVVGRPVERLLDLA